jgi:hypothetical protein
LVRVTVRRTASIWRIFARVLRARRNRAEFLSNMIGLRYFFFVSFKTMVSSE